MEFTMQELIYLGAALIYPLEELGYKHPDYYDLSVLRAKIIAEIHKRHDAGERPTK